ncbi:MAG: hypothetical protein O3B47_04820 [bacterium]|nr:hypothetical protein [bacterium]
MSEKIAIQVEDADLDGSGKNEKNHPGFVKSSTALGRGILWARNAFSDVLENVSGVKIGEAVGFRNLSGEPLEKFLPADMKAEILELTKDYTEGVFYRAKVAAGKKENFTKHGHYFYFRKIQGGVQLYFVDPEFSVGRKNALRPPVCNLMATELNANHVFEKVSILRFAAVGDKSLSVKELTDSCLKMLNGHEPKIFDGDDFDKTFRLDLRGGSQEIESRHASDAELRQFLRTGKGNLHIDGKAWAQRGVLSSFVRHLRDGKFKPAR